MLPFTAWYVWKQPHRAALRAVWQRLITVIQSIPFMHDHFKRTECWKRAFVIDNFPHLLRVSTNWSIFLDFLGLLWKRSPTESPHYHGKVRVGHKLLEILTKEISNVMNKWFIFNKTQFSFVQVPATKTTRIIKAQIEEFSNITVWFRASWQPSFDFPRSAGARRRFYFETWKKTDSLRPCFRCLEWGGLFCLSPQ